MPVRFPMYFPVCIPAATERAFRVELSQGEVEPLLQERLFLRIEQEFVGRQRRHSDPALVGKILEPGE